MSPVREASLTALREIRRNLASTKGIALFIFFFLGGSLWALLELVLVKLTGRDPLAGMSLEERQQYFEAILSTRYDAPTAHYLSFCPPQLLSVPGALALGLFEGTVIFAPLLILLIGFDQIAGDIQHRAIRYIAGRSRRGSIAAGKALGLWAVIGFLMLLLNVMVWILVLARGGATAGEIFTWGPRLWVLQVVTAAPWVGLITLLSSSVRTPTIALFVGVAVFPTLWVTNKILELIVKWGSQTADVAGAQVPGYVSYVKAAQWALPFRYEELLLSPEPASVLSGVGAYLAWGALMSAIAALIVKRRDV